MVYIGVDPGISPALSALNEKCELLWMKDVPCIQTGTKNVINGQDLKDALLGADHVFIEKAQTMPGQGIASSGNYMKSAGIIEGICIGLGIPYTLIPPVTWKKKMMFGMEKGKEASLLKVQQLYPNSVKLIKDNHKAEALLICLYGIKYMVGSL